MKDKTRKEATAFATWISDNNYNPEYGKWFVHVDDIRKEYTSRQLYNKYLKEKKKSSSHER